MKLPKKLKKVFPCCSKSSASSKAKSSWRKRLGKKGALLSLLGLSLFLFVLVEILESQPSPRIASQYPMELAPQAPLAEYATVCSQGCDYATIQAAIDTGETDIRVALGTYTSAAPLDDEVLNIPLGNPEIAIRGGYETGNWETAVGKSTIDAENEKRCVYVSGGSPTFENFEFINGSASEVESHANLGGCIYASVAISLNSCRIFNCHASDRGGGMYAERNIEIKNSLIQHNDNGGLFAQTPGQSLSIMIKNSQFSRNTGEGLSVTHDHTGEVVNSNFVYNTGNGISDGFHNTIDYDSLIIAYNTGYGFYNEREDDDTVQNTVFFGNESGDIGAGSTGEVTTENCCLGPASENCDPQFVAQVDIFPESWFHIGRGSSAKDRGPIDAYGKCLIDHDIDGQIRPQGVGCDAGPDEYWLPTNRPGESS